MDKPGNPNAPVTHPITQPQTTPAPLDKCSPLTNSPKPRDTNTSTCNNTSSPPSNISNHIGNYSESQSGQNYGSPKNDSYTSHKNTMYGKHSVSLPDTPNPLRGNTKHQKDVSPDDPLNTQAPNAQEQQYLDPQRHWSIDRTNQNPVSNNRDNADNDRYLQTHTAHTSRPQNNLQQDRGTWLYRKPRHISEKVKQISTVGPDGSTVKTTTAVTKHDGVEVSNKITQDIRLRRINQLEATGASACLGGSKRPDYLKLFITKLDPDTTPENMEHALLHYFPDLERVAARKLRMIRNSAYCSFTVFVTAKPGVSLHLDDFVNFNWPDDVHCYPALERQEQDRGV